MLKFSTNHVRLLFRFEFEKSEFEIFKKTSENVLERKVVQCLSDNNFSDSRIFSVEAARQKLKEIGELAIASPQSRQSSYDVCLILRYVVLCC